MAAVNIRILSGNKISGRAKLVKESARLLDNSDGELNEDNYFLRLLTLLNIP